MSRLENARHDRAVALRLRMNWCAGHDRTLNGEKRTHADPLLLSSGMADAWIVQSKHQLGSMLRDRLAYAAQLEAHKAVNEGGRWVRTGTRLTATWPRYSDLPWIRDREVFRWEWAR